MHRIKLVETSVQNRVAVVLVRARNPLNIGAAARAMSNFGFNDLRVVNDYTVPFEDARSAVDAAPVLARAQSCATVAEALADCSLVLGTTALGDRKLVHPVEVLRDAAARIQEHAGGTENGTTHRVAILFGSEKTGLSNEEMSFCHVLTTIPMVRGGVSMNLGQAVAVCLYELVRTAPAQRTLPQPDAPATAAQLARFEQLLREVLVASDYQQRFPGNMGEEAMRRLVLRLGLPAADTEAWMGMLRQVLWKLHRES